MKEQKKREASQMSSANSACRLAGDTFGVCGGVQLFPLAVRPSETSRMAAANGQSKKKQTKKQSTAKCQEKLFPLRLRLCRCAHNVTPRIPSPSYLNSSSAPLHSFSPSHNPPFAPSNYNSINQSFAVTMATAMLGTGPRVARGHHLAIDHHHLLHQKYRFKN